MPPAKKPAQDAEVETTDIRIVGVGAFIAPAGSDVRRPYGHGKELTVAKDVADQLLADGVAVLQTDKGEVTVVVDVTPNVNPPLIEDAPEGDA